MILYRLHVAPAESDGEGEDHDEWFSSFRAAKSRRAELIRECNGEHWLGEDFQIDRVTVPDGPAKRLALWCLNRRWLAAPKTLAVSAWREK